MNSETKPSSTTLEMRDCIRALRGQGKQLLRMLLWKYVQEQACLILFHPLHVTLEKQDKLHFFYAKSLGFLFFLIYIY